MKIPQDFPGYPNVLGRMITAVNGNGALLPAVIIGLYFKDGSLACSCAYSPGIFSKCPTFFESQHALNEAVGLCRKALRNLDLTVRTHLIMRSRIETYLDRPDEMLRRIARRYEKGFIISEGRAIVCRATLSGKIYMQNDAPVKYHLPGTKVWFIDTDSPKVVRRGVIQIVELNLQYGEIYYRCGSHSHLNPDNVFKTKKGAISRVCKLFNQKNGGTYDPDDVEIGVEISKEESYQASIARFTELAENRNFMDV